MENQEKEFPLTSILLLKLAIPLFQRTFSCLHCSKKDLEGPEGRFFHKNGYGSDKESDIWPPWIPLEMCFDGSLLDKHVFLKRRSMFLTYVAPNPLFFSANDTSAFSYDSRFRIAFPGLVLTSDCQQYCAVYAIAEDLLSLWIIIG
ncbi:ANM_collapsed_G0058440.mRNA.1.CDS.1 [Saccharomyces cerevisiae]|nr:ANM_collapsed_G0058440.mRNA.1.CDS.1 [Saccharomyces cerevisiae]